MLAVNPPQTEPNQPSTNQQPDSDPASSDSVLCASALRYANLGWPVFPLRPGTKKPAVPKHTAHNCDSSDPKCADGHTGWEQRATTNPERIRKAWGKADFGIGIACGPANLLVVDLDLAKAGQLAGWETLQLLERQTGHKLPNTLTIGTPSGGYHLYYQQPLNCRFGNTTNRVGEGIDTRGHGGYVVAPPSEAPGSKHRYYVTLRNDPVTVLPQWFSEHLHNLTLTPRNVEPQQLPQSTAPLKVHGRLNHGSGTDSTVPLPIEGRLAHYVETAICGQLNQLTQAPKGQRNHTLFITAVALGQLAAAGVADQTEVMNRVLTAAACHIPEGFTWAEAQKTVQSGINRGLNQPRKLPAHLTQ